LEIIISPIDSVGIFDSTTDYDEFENKCLQCKRYRDGKCSLLNKIKENRIIEEVQLLNNKWTCNKWRE